MKILVTGGAGFIASHLVDSLIDIGHEVMVIDNLSTGKLENVNPAARLHVLDIMDEEVQNVFASFKPEIVYHHAAQIDVQTSLKHSLLDAKINILGTIRILELCRDHGVRKIIYASSAAVYGSPQYLGVDEKHPVHPLSFYGISKHTPEQYIEVFSSLWGMDYTILRYANVFGPRQDPKGEGGVVSIFIDRLLDGKTPRIYGDGEQTRDFIYVKDIVSANIASLFKGSKGIYNISRNEQITVNELLRAMCDICGTPFTAEYVDERAGDIRHSCLDNSAAKASLDWRPSYTLIDGLRETCQYYADIYRSNVKR
jgi:UDP-glucose 4-epimerase